MMLENNIIDTALKKSSFIGLLTLYFIKIRFDKKEAFHKSELEKIRSGEYAYAYFVAFSSFDLIEYTFKNDIINITSFNIYLSQVIYATLLSRAKLHDEEYVNEVKWIDDIKRIESI